MLLWAIARSAGFIAFAAYTLVVTWGVLVAGRAFRPAAPAVHFHRFLSTLGLVAVATHIAALLGDHFAKVGLINLVGLHTRPALVPGVIALWLTIALPLSFRLRKAKWISQPAWRGFHWFGYAVWGLALIHGVWSGTDSNSPFALAAYAASAGLVAGAATWRFSAKPATPPRQPVRTPAPVSAARRPR
jgi:methionine sulfoxide reductase heme-binding subunit